MTTASVSKSGLMAICRYLSLRLKDVSAIRVGLQVAAETRDLALFDLAIDSKVRACDLPKLRVLDVAYVEPDIASSRESAKNTAVRAI